jgi:hypothetical protein
MYPGDIRDINKDWIDCVLNEMSEHAAELGLERGAAAIMISPLGMTQPKEVHFVYTRAYFMGQSGNHLGLALTKIARMAHTMFSTQQDGGLEVVPGENNELGGIVLHFVTGEIFFAFSGGTPEQNDEVARYGVTVSKFCDLGK